MRSHPAVGGQGEGGGRVPSALKRRGVFPWRGCDGAGGGGKWVGGGPAREEWRGQPCQRWTRGRAEPGRRPGEGTNAGREVAANWFASKATRGVHSRGPRLLSVATCGFVLNVGTLPEPKPE